jgi:hypothetical protein
MAGNIGVFEGVDGGFSRITRENDTLAAVGFGVRLRRPTGRRSSNRGPELALSFLWEDRPLGEQQQAEKLFSLAPSGSDGFN